MIMHRLYKLFPQIYSLLSNNSIYCFKFLKVGNNSFLHRETQISNSEFIEIGSDVTIQKDAWLNVILDNPGKIIIEDGANIGMRVTLSAAKLIRIGRNVLFGTNVYIADHEHVYELPNKPIMYQGIIAGEGVSIGKDSWIGNNVVIFSSKKLTVGKHCIIGSNSLVKKSIPDYSVVVGNPAKIVKKYDKKRKMWVKV